MSDRLAIQGGEPAVTSVLKEYNSIGAEELEAAKNVVSSGVLSEFLGCWSDEFYGGKNIRLFEEEFARYFGVKHAITFNSLTSGLIAAVGALGLEPGDEIIVTPWTMCSTVTSILHWNCIPVFADIDRRTYNIDPESVKKNITKRTRAIIAADIFGQSCDIDSLNDIAKENSLYLITDTAQAPGSYHGDKFTGTEASIGGFSLNYHKHIHTGEGGVMVTNDDVLAERLQLIRNHGEAVVEDKGTNDISNIIGYNFRMGEIEAAIGIEQLKKLEFKIKDRQRIANRLTDGLRALEGLVVPYVEEGNTHSYYVYPIQIDSKKITVSRERVIEALTAEGVHGLSAGFDNIHLLPMFQKKIAYGKKGFPWVDFLNERQVDYSKGICPVAESLNDTAFICYELCLYEMDNADVDAIIEAFNKVWCNLDFLD